MAEELQNNEEELQNELAEADNELTETDLQQVQASCGPVDLTVDFCCVSNIPRGFTLVSPIKRENTRFAWNQDGLCVDIEQCNFNTTICNTPRTIPVYQVRLRGYIPAIFNVSVQSTCGVDSEAGTLPRCLPGEERPGNAFICCHDTIFVDNVLFCSPSQSEVEDTAARVLSNLESRCLDLRNFNVQLRSIDGSVSCPGYTSSCRNTAVQFLGTFNFQELLKTTCTSAP